MLHLQQELFMTLQDTLLNLDMILHQFPLLSAQIDRFLQTPILMIILKLPINIMIPLIIPFILQQTQLPILISTKITLKLIQLQQHKTPSYNYHVPLLHRIYILKIKQLCILPLLILISHKLFKEDFKTLHLHIYQLILCIRCIQIQILTLIQIHYNEIQSNIYLLNSPQQIAPPLQYLPMPQDTFMNMSASIPEPMKPFDGLDHSYTPEEYLQQVEARLTFAIGEQPQNNPIKYKSWHYRCMAYIQCSLTGTAIDWYTNLHISYKQQWNSFVQLFKKQFSSQKTAYYAQVEAMSLMKKDNETVRHFALRVQQLVKKGWCNENAATINLKNIEIFTKGLPKKLKDFAHKRQAKHVSTLLEPSIPFHTLVRHVDSEDIANEKIRTNDLALEINKVSLEDDTSKKEFEHEDHIMVTQSGDPNNKSKQTYRKHCSYCHKNNHCISNCYQKQRDDKY